MHGGIDAGHTFALGEAIIASGSGAGCISCDGIPDVCLGGGFAGGGEALFALHAHIDADFECVLVASHEGEFPSEFTFLFDEASNFVLFNFGCIFDAIGEDDDGGCVDGFVFTLVVDEQF